MSDSRNRHVRFFTEPGTNRRFYYDSHNDQLVYEDGSRLARPPNISRTALGAPARNQTSSSSSDYYQAPQTRTTKTGERYGSTSGSAGPAPRTAPYDSRSDIQQAVTSFSSTPARDFPRSSARDVPDSYPQLSSSFRNVNIGSPDQYQGQGAPVGPMQRPAVPAYPDPVQSQPQWPGYGQAPSYPNANSTTQSSRQPSVPTQVQHNEWERGNQRIIEAYDGNNDIRTRIQTAPPDQITPPDLLSASGGRSSRGLLMGTSNTPGDTERLDPAYSVRSYRFFRIGRVFLVLWVEPMGTTTVTNIESMPGRYQGERGYSKVRRFVVIREDATMCTVLPIMTYGGQGVGKPGVVKSEHAVIYTGPHPPQELRSERPIRGEAGMRPTPIRVVPDNPTDKLDPLSRIGFAQIHTVQHNVKVKPFGVIHDNSMAALLSQFSNAFNAESPSTTRMRRSAASSASAIHRRLSGTKPPRQQANEEDADESSDSEGNDNNTDNDPEDDGDYTSQNLSSRKADKQPATRSRTPHPSEFAHKRGNSQIISGSGTTYVATEGPQTALNYGEQPRYLPHMAQGQDARAGFGTQAQGTHPIQTTRLSNDQLMAMGRQMQPAYLRSLAAGNSEEEAFRALVTTFQRQDPSVSRVTAESFVRRCLNSRDGYLDTISYTADQRQSVSVTRRQPATSPRTAHLSELTRKGVTSRGNLGSRPAELTSELRQPSPAQTTQHPVRLDSSTRHDQTDGVFGKPSISRLTMKILTDSIVESLSELIDLTNDNKIKNWAETQRARILIWADTLGVCRDGQASLEYRLRQARDLYELNISVLEVTLADIRALFEALGLQLNTSILNVTAHTAADEPPEDIDEELESKPSPAALRSHIEEDLDSIIRLSRLSNRLASR